MGFKSNGKLGRIYHWNLPVLKKMLSKGDNPKSSKLRLLNNVNDLIDIKNIPTWSNTHKENASIGKKPNANDVDLKIFKNKTPTYYAPMVPKKSEHSTKYFPGNGKPQGFYVIKKNPQKLFYHNLIP